MSAWLAPRPEQAGRRWVPGLFLTLVAGATSPLDQVLAGMVRRGLGCEAIRLYLRFSCDALDNALARLGLPRPHERPLRRPHPRGWGLIEIWKLVALWVGGVHPTTIGVLLGRSEGSVRSKAYRLGLPRRDRKLLTRDLAIAARVAVAAASAAPAHRAANASALLPVTSTPASPAARSLGGCSDGVRATDLATSVTNIAALPGSGKTLVAAQIDTANSAARKALQRLEGQIELRVPGIIAVKSASNDSAVHRNRGIRLPEALSTNGAGEIRAETTAAVGCPRRVGEVRWTKERIVEASLRAFARQHPARIAQEMGVSYSAVESTLCRGDMPREYGKGPLVDHYDRALGEANMKASGYKLDICRKTGWYYWRHEKDVASRLCRIGRRRETAQARGSLPGCSEATV